ncbi:MAG: hypothetical protein PHQ66_03490 [Candidatus Nanoarchaeia archaeon]|nr:hypothetical protein [Candidatus Nanoarchaeia archaeon]MDD5357574.1 hypothetical protein [Candidatus Nanoarchaeia archaeon]MDD5588493.1 hypothetical protein [Candidatus Nanoarchaeia archaeon]
MKKVNNKGQEEIVGFVVIIVIVSVAMIILLWFLLNSPSESAVENFEIESFIQTTLQYTTSCEGQVEFLSLQNLIIACNEGGKCLDESDSCVVLNETLKEIIESSWPVSEQSAIKGYKLNVYIEDLEALQIQKGNETTNYKGAFQDFARSGKDYKVSLNVYY